MNLPNKLTVARCVMTFAFLAVLLSEVFSKYTYGIALVIFIAASLTDMLDGKIARKRGLITNLGKFLDPLADKTLTTAALLGIMTVLPYHKQSLCWAVMLILTREFMVTSVRLLAAKDGVVVAASFAGKCKTVMQMVAIIYMLTAMQTVVLLPKEGFDWLAKWLLVAGLVLVWISVVATVISGIQYVWNLRGYLKEE